MDSEIVINGVVFVEAVEVLAAEELLPKGQSICVDIVIRGL